ncbi:MAG: CHAD domain-containing protein [Acidithiobacillus sp.]
MEQELKLQIMEDSPSIWKKIIDYPLLAIDQASPLLMHAFYYDSRDGALQRARLAYRVRREGDAWVATLKGEGQSAGGLHQRPEWNVPVSSQQPDLTVFTDPQAVQLLAPYRDASLQAILETRFERYESRVVHSDQSEVLIALDRGEILARGLRENILEIELELAQGTTAALLEMGETLCRALPLLPDDESKLFRGLRLAGLIAVDGKSQREAVPALRRRENAGAALSILLIQQSQLLLYAVRKYWAEPHTENFHQLRIQVRTLRALLRFCQDLDLEKRLHPGRLALREWFHQQNRRRDHDALIHYWEDLAQATGVQPDPLLQELHARIAAEPVDFKNIITTTLGIWALLIRHPLQSDQDLQHYAENRLQHADHKLLTAGKMLNEDPADIHALRIQIKNWRYALLALSTLWPSKDSKTLLKLLATLQGIAGELQDAHMAGSHLKTLASSRKSSIAFNAGMLWGYLQGRESRQHKKLRKFWERLKSTPRPWS